MPIPENISYKKVATEYLTSEFKRELWIFELEKHITTKTLSENDKSKIESFVNALP